MFMAAVYKEFEVAVPLQFAWEAVKAFGDVHNRLAQGFVTHTTLDGSVRTITFADGFTVKEQLVTADDELHRLTYSATGGRALHHNAAFQLSAKGDCLTAFVWATDILPDEAKESIEQKVLIGIDAIRATLESTYRQAINQH
jgi:hypothetical protein